MIKLMAKVQIVEDNTAPPFEITLKRGKLRPQVIDLSGSTVDLYVVQNGSTLNTGHTSCTLTDPSNGVITYEPEATDFPSKGVYVCEAKVVYGDSTEEVIYETLTVEVRKRVA